MLKINQFDFERIWNAPDYYIGDIRYLGVRVRGIPVYTGKNEKGPFVGFADNSFVSFVSEFIGKLFPNIQFYGAHNDIILIVQLMDLDMDSFFSVFAAALISEIENSSEDTEDVILRYCHEWEVLFHETRTVQKVIGLVGEMYFLSLLIAEGITDVSWNLGLNSPQDFLIEKNVLAEVKTTCSHSEYCVQIHGVEQLECPNGKKLHLLFIRMSKANGGAFSIKKLLDSIPSKYISSEAYKVIEEIPEEMKSMSFDCIEAGDYSVDNSFPRLTRNSIGLLPCADSIVNVDYRLNLQPLVCENILDFINSLKK